MDLYHGTSSYYHEMIKADGVLRCAPHGDQHVSFSRDKSIAAKAAQTSVDIVNSDFDANATPVILKTSSEALKGAGLRHALFSSMVWGEGNCDHEQEIACYDDVPYALVSVE